MASSSDTWLSRDNNHNYDDNNNNTSSEQSKEFFEVEIPTEAEFTINAEDWAKLKAMQKAHRFMKGEWEDYFVLGMKESNKYCVFAFKDHYVNQTNIRAREAKMQDGARGYTNNSSASDNSNSSNKAKSKPPETIKNKKIFSACGYCVFQDCSVKFFLKMSADRTVHVYYVGKLQHSCTEVRGRFFRGKSRQELKEILKHSTPMREFKHRLKNSPQLEVGNADYVGKSSSVYRRISAEAKDSYQTLFLLKKQLIQRSLIQMSKLKLKVVELFESKLFEKAFLRGTILIFT